MGTGQVGIETALPETTEAPPRAVTRKLVKRPDMTWHDHLIMLLNLGSAIEHALMVQYLYAAYSLGGEQVPVEHRPMVQRWQETTLSVAREEMAHMLMVQNILTLLGAGVNLSRENFPWDVDYYPFPFVLEPFTRGALACYVYAEEPVGEEFPEKDQVRKVAYEHARQGGREHGTELHPVGEIYDEIICLIQDESRIPDTAFQEESVSIQASWDDWGRQYGPDPRQLDAVGNRVPLDAHAPPADTSRAQLLIRQVATRTEAVNALKALSAQGEGPHAAAEGEQSHFQRFLGIFRDYENVFGPVEDPPWSPARPLVVNPNTREVRGTPNHEGYIFADNSRHWALLFNTRYRMLLNLLSHTFRLARTTRPDEPSLRAVLMHRVFCEMYNLKAISRILVQLPLSDRVEPGRPVLHAGPPFEMPYSLALPPDETSVWKLHLDVLGSADKLCKALLARNPRPTEQAYLQTVFDLDSQTRLLFNTVLSGLGSHAGGRA